MKNFFHCISAGVQIICVGLLYLFGFYRAAIISRVRRDQRVVATVYASDVTPMELASALSISVKTVAVSVYDKGE